MELYLSNPFVSWINRIFAVRKLAILLWVYQPFLLYGLNLAWHMPYLFCYLLSLTVLHATTAMWSRKLSVSSAVSGISKCDDGDIPLANGIQLYPFAIALRVRVLQVSSSIPTYNHLTTRVSDPVHRFRYEQNGRPYRGRGVL